MTNLAPPANVYLAVVTVVMVKVIGMGKVMTLVTVLAVVAVVTVAALMINVPVVTTTTDSLAVTPSKFVTILRAYGCSGGTFVNQLVSSIVITGTGQVSQPIQICSSIRDSK